MTTLQPSSSASPGEELAVGSRLRHLRTARRLTLKEVADGAGVSESFLSQVERGRAMASISSLKRIADALAVEIHELFTPHDPGATRVVRASDGEVLRFGEGASKRLLTPRPLEGLEVVVCDFAVGGHSGDEPYVHGDAEEVCVVLAGEVQHRVGDEVFTLRAGDAAHYRSSAPHRTANTGDVPARVLYAITPPTF